MKDGFLKKLIILVEELESRYTFPDHDLPTRAVLPIKITNSWNCIKDADRELIVADYKSTYLLLKEKKEEYLLFFDEPTVLTDIAENNITLNV